MKTTFKIALLLCSVAMFGCDAGGPATPPENPDPAPSEAAESADAPSVGNPDGSDGGEEESN